MKYTLFIMSFLTVFQIMHPALSYIEVGEYGDAKATAGEQNTNLYRLNLQGSLALKKLKKVDDIVARGKASGQDIIVSDINNLLASDAEQQEREALVFLAQDLNKRLSNPKVLRTADSSAVYSQIREMKSDVRDEQTSKKLRYELRGRF